MKFSAARLREFILSDKGRKALIICGVCVMILLLISALFGGEKTSADNDVRENTASIEKALEKRLCELISKIDGAGEVSVMITLETSSEAVYERNGKASNSSGSSSKETEVALAGSSKQPIQAGSILPTVRGAAVVCSGAGNPLVKEKVANVVAKALNIGMSRVYVTC